MHHIKSILVEAIDGVMSDKDKKTFDTHAVEKWVLRRHTVECGKALAAITGDGDPLTEFSRQFSLLILNTFCRGEGRGVEQVMEDGKPKKVKSANLGGDDSPNQEWRRTADPLRTA